MADKGQPNGENHEPKHGKGRGVIKHSRHRQNKANQSVGAQSRSQRYSSSSESDIMNGSRYQSLSKTCRHCDGVCEERSGEKSTILQCLKCKLYSHIDCELGDNDILYDLKSRGSFLCDECKGKANQTFTSERSEDADLDSTMDSDEKRRAVDF